MNILIVVLKHSIQHVKELDLILDHRHPAEIKLEEQEEGQEALASDDDTLMLMKLHQTLEERFFSQENVIDFRVHVGRQRQIKHCDKGLLDTWSSFSQCVTVDGRSDSFKDGVEELWVQPANVAQSDGRADLERLVELRLLLGRSSFSEIGDLGEENRQ